MLKWFTELPTPVQTTIIGFLSFVAAITPLALLFGGLITSIGGIVTLLGTLSTATNKWFGGILAPNGRIYGIPYNSTAILEIDPADSNRR